MSMTETTIWNELSSIVEKGRKELLKEEFRDEPSDAVVMGLLISKFFSWNAFDIIQTSIIALSHAKQTELAKQLNLVWQEQNN